VAFDAGPGGADAGIVLPVDAAIDARDPPGETIVDALDGATTDAALDAGPRDATVLDDAQDAGELPLPSSQDESGCGCRVGAEGRFPRVPLLVSIVAVLAFLTRRRRGDGSFRRSRDPGRPGRFKRARVW
jgi:MYXO-CTERM domain-containing protein